MPLSSTPISQAVGSFYVLLVLNPDQHSPTFMGWSGSRADVQEAADEIVAKNPRNRAVILETVETISAVASLRSVDSKTGEESKRPVKDVVVRVA